MIKRKPPISRGLYKRTMVFSSVGVERFELPTSCSQSRLRILYKSNFTSVSVVEIEPFYKQKTPQMWGLIDFLFNYETKLSQLYFLFELRLCTKFSFSIHQQSFVNLLFYYQKLQLQYYWQNLLHNL